MELLLRQNEQAVLRQCAEQESASLVAEEARHSHPDPDPHSSPNPNPNPNHDPNPYLNPNPNPEPQPDPNPNPNPNTEQGRRAAEVQLERATSALRVLCASVHEERDKAAAARRDQVSHG